MASHPHHSYSFTHFRSFSELRLWSANDLLPTQRSNTPLLTPRYPSIPTEPRPSPKSNITLIHDYAGAYHAYESSSSCPPVVPEESYSCDRLNHVDTFVYFSHLLVTVPPPAWINACHRQGVKVLGTLIVEPPTSALEAILERDEYGSFWVVEKLASLAATIGFEGWLVNIEKPFPLLSWNPSTLVAVLTQLRSLLGQHGKVIWYDALTTLNTVTHQNALTPLNLPFALAAGNILTNYAWTPTLARASIALAEANSLPPQNLIFGIDVWAQNAQPHTRHRRVTYPRTGGGGTGTGLGVRELAALGLGCGIFAPAWTFEHFASTDRANVESAVWDGCPLDVGVKCPCWPARPHSAHEWHGHGVARYAARFVAGSDMCFFTDFRRAFARVGGKLCAELAAQMPSPSDIVGKIRRKYTADQSCGNLRADVLDSPSRCAIVLFDVDQQRVGIEGVLPLFDLHIHPADGLVSTLHIRYHARERQGIVLAFEAVTASGKVAVSVPVQYGDSEDDVLHVDAAIKRCNEAVTELRIRFSASHLPSLSEEEVLVEIYSIAITPSQQVAPPHITNLHITTREAACTLVLLEWELTPSPSQRSPSPQSSSQASSSPPSSSQLPLHQPQQSQGHGMPISQVTGPISYFEISVDDEILGRAYALAFVVPSNLAERWERDGMVRVKVVGVGFDGRALCHVHWVVSWRETHVDWVVVEAD